MDKKQAKIKLAEMQSRLVIDEPERCAILHGLNAIKRVEEYRGLLHRVNDLINSDAIEMRSQSMRNHPLHADIRKALDE